MEAILAVSRRLCTWYIMNFIPKVLFLLMDYTLYVVVLFFSYLQVISTAEGSEQRVAHGSASGDKCAKGNILNLVTVQSSVDPAATSQRLILRCAV